MKTTSLAELCRIANVKREDVKDIQVYRFLEGNKMIITHYGAISCYRCKCIDLTNARGIRLVTAPDDKIYEISLFQIGYKKDNWRQPVNLDTADLIYRYSGL